MGIRPPVRGTALALAGSIVQHGAAGHRRIPMPVEDLFQATLLAEATGYEAVFVPDHGVWEPFALLASFAQRTSQLGLATGVVTMTSRSPEVMGTAAATLNQVSEGRAILGVGSGQERRVDRVASYLDDLRDHRPDGLPLYLAALGDRMVRLAGARSEGVLLNWCSPARVERAREEVDRTHPRRVVVAVYVRACLGHEEEHALAALREAVGMYAAIPAYRRQLEAEGLGGQAAAAAEAAGRGDPWAIPEELVDALCVRGGRDQALARLDEYRAAGADLVVVYPVTAQEPASSLMGTIMGAAPDPSVEA
ncbi:MAG: LLM class flavin-dependent oxidoreductase [Actinomycetota bacterium]